MAKVIKNPKTNQNGKMALICRNYSKINLSPGPRTEGIGAKFGRNGGRGSGDKAEGPTGENGRTVQGHWEDPGEPKAKSGEENTGKCEKIGEKDPNDTGIRCFEQVNPRDLRTVRGKNYKPCRKSHLLQIEELSAKLENVKQQLVQRIDQEEEERWGRRI